MTYKIEITSEARSDLRQIREYISIELDNEKAASKTIGNIIKRIRLLEDFPEIGAPLNSRITEKSDYRYLVCGNYNVFYRVEDQTARIVRVLHARRNFMAILFGKDF